MGVQSVNNNQNNHSPILIGGTAVAGSVVGGVYVRNHLPEKTMQQIDKFDIYSPDYFKRVRDSIDIQKAEEESVKGNLDKKEFGIIKGFYDKLTSAFTDEIQVRQIRDIPYNQRQVSLTETIKKANRSRIEVAKASFHFPKELNLKMISLGFLNKEKMTNVLSEYKAKSFQSLKIMAKPVALGSLIGSVFGAVLGLGFSELFKSNEN